MKKAHPQVDSGLLRTKTAVADKAPYLWATISMVVGLLAAAITLKNGAISIMAPWDVFLLLDGGWRIHVGQIPHLDFYNPIGPLTYQLISFGMLIKGPSTGAIAIGIVVFLVVIVPWAWVICSHRLSGFLAAVFTTFVSIIVVAARPLGYEPEITTYAMLYNRFGWVLLSVLCVQIFIPLRKVSQRSYVLEGVSIGALLCLLFLCKVNFFGMAVLGVLLASVLRPDLRQSIPYQMVAFIGICVVWWLALGSSPFDYLADLRSAAEAQSLRHRADLLIATAKENATAIYLLAVFGISALLLRFCGERGPALNRAVIRLTMTLIFLVVATLLIAAGNAPEGRDLPLWFVGSIMVMQFMADHRQPESQPYFTPSHVVFILTAAIAIPFLCGHIMYKDMLSLAYATKRNAYKTSLITQSQRFQSKSLQDFVIPESAEWRTAYGRAKNVPARINDGIRLLRRYVKEDSRIYTLAFANPFPFALQLPSPKGGPLWWDLNYSISKEKLPKAANVFGDVDFVMIPRYREDDDGCCWETARLLLETYGPYLDKFFPEIDRTDYWILRRLGDYRE